MPFFIALLPVLALQASVAQGLPNGGFEAQFEGWAPSAWAREAGSAKATLDPAVARTGKASVHIEHRGSQDWSFERAQGMAVEPGELFELEAWTRGQGKLNLSVVTYGENDGVERWQFGLCSVRATPEWQALRTRILVPPGVKRIRPRLTGEGPAALWVDDVSANLAGRIADWRDPALPPEVKLDTSVLQVTFLTAPGTFEVLDKRTGRTWRQEPGGAEMTVLRASRAGERLDVEMFYAPGASRCRASLALDAKTAELELTLAGEGEMSRAVAWPGPFTGGSDLIVPMNEGITYPVADESIVPMALIAYGGHGICMPWWGVTEGETGHMALFVTADDAAIRMDRPQKSKRLHIAPEWQPQKGQFGDARRLRYVFFDKGGYVAMAKRYRRYAKDTGLLKTLEEKRREVPATDLLVGAANVWCWDKDGPAWAKELRAAGIERILWSNRQSPANVSALNDMGVLTSRYDIYQDTMDPAQFPRLNGLHGDWTTEAWERGDLMRDARGDWIRGWEVRAKDGSMVPCGVLCDLRAPDYARRRIPAELATHPYRCRFIDTTTAAPWRECYDPAHAVTRTESRKKKMELLDVVSRENRLVCGSETGHDAAVPFVHYFEGMLSLGPYRVPDAGRQTQRIWDEVPERVAKFQLGERYRLPLWELVYHDCVVAQWYWGDYNNKLPSLWDKRDLFNALYGTPPMFMFDRKIWDKNRDRFVQSYRATAPVARETGFSEMTSHRWLTPDRSVQQTQFANGVTVTVNFGSHPCKLDSGDSLAPLSVLVRRAS